MSLALGSLSVTLSRPSVCLYAPLPTVPNALLDVAAAMGMCGAATPPHAKTGGKSGQRPIVHLASRCSLLLPPPHRHDDGHYHGSRGVGSLLARLSGCGAALSLAVLPVVAAGVVVGSGAVGLGDVTFLGGIQIDEGQRHPCRSSPSATPLTSNVVALEGMCGAATVPHRATTPGRGEPLVLPLGSLRNLRPAQLDVGDHGYRWRPARCHLAREGAASVFSFRVAARPPPSATRRGHDDAGGGGAEW